MPAGYPAVILGEGTVYGEVITLSQDKILKSLDLLEGYMGEGEENLYVRVKQKVHLEDGSQQMCWVYIYVDEKVAKKEGKYIPHGDWKEFKNNKK